MTLLLYGGLETLLRRLKNDDDVATELLNRHYQVVHSQQAQVDERRDGRKDGSVDAVARQTTGGSKHRATATSREMEGSQETDATSCDRRTVMLN